MIAFPLDFIRQIIYQTLDIQHTKNPNLVGGQNQVSLFSFYEQLQQQEEIDRFTDIYRDLIEQQNRTGLIANGVIVSPENPTMTNINQATIIPLTFTATFRCTLANRDLVLTSLNNLFDIHKGRKVDIAEFDNGKLFVVGTCANNVNGTPELKNGDYLGTVAQASDTQTLINNLVTLGVETNIDEHSWFYVSHLGKLKVVILVPQFNTWYFVEDNNTRSDIYFPPEHESFTKWKVSISFDAMRCDEPRTLNAEEYCQISFSGSATICNAKVRLGNDLVKLGIKKYLIKGTPNIDLSASALYWLEPLEIPSSINANTKPIQLLSNAFKTNSHTDSINPSLQYTFIVDTEIALLEQWYDYGRYGIVVESADGVSPNMIYQITEIYSSWGNYKQKVIKAKLVESLDIDNTEGDILTITTSFQVQGDN